LIREGCSPKQIQAFVGHNSISETMDTYGHLFEGDVSDLAERLDQSVRRKKVSKKFTLAI
jgi:integrase